MPSNIRGLMAALLTPRSPSGQLDRDGLLSAADFALSRGASGVVPCGGTGEYFDISVEQRKEIVELLAPAVRGRGTLVAGVGSASLSDSVDLARHALQAGAAAVLLPPPHFYRYGDAELLQYFREAARAIAGPVLLYNLAGFVSPIGEAVAAELLDSEAHIVGIKDSSGELGILRRLTFDGTDCTRIQGHDARLPDSIREGLLDGAISGPAGVVPELSAALFDTFGDDRAFSEAAAFNREFLDRFASFPYPWALKWIAEWRNACRPSLPFPLGPEQERSRAAFREWFGAWLARLEVFLGQDPPPGADRGRAAA